MADQEPKREHIPHHISVPLGLKIVFGCIASTIATATVHPLDVIKVRMQLPSNYSTAREMALHIVQCRGYRALYCGISAGLMRQATNTTTKLAIYHKLYTDLRKKKNSRPTLLEKMKIGALASVVGAVAGNPSEVALVRMMADGRVEPCVCNVPPIYRNVFHALHRISKEEGMKALWRGGTLTVGRAFFVTMTQLSSYEKLHDVLEHTDLTSGLTLHVCCTLLSTFFTAFISLPVDLVKTRYQVRKCNITQNEIFSEIYKKKGLGYFWKGFVPYYVRLAVQSLLAYMLVHELNYHYKR